MVGQDSSYSGWGVAIWDLHRPDHENWDDRFLYQNVIKQYGEPALDVACATGRLMLTYMKEGIDVDGVALTPSSKQWICIQRPALRRSEYGRTSRRIRPPKRISCSR